MNNPAKIHLSPLETELVNNTEWIFTKQKIIEKVYCLFGELHHNFKKMIDHENDFLPAVLHKPGGKISRGENYKGLPFVILDYPAAFSKENIFAVRTMFWWGNFFSISLHLSGKYFNRNEIPGWLNYFQPEGFFVCVSESQWEHDFSDQNFIKINTMNEKQIATLREKHFFKVSKKIELNQWNNAPAQLEQGFKEIISFVRINFPAGEITL